MREILPGCNVIAWMPRILASWLVMKYASDVDIGLQRVAVGVSDYIGRSASHRVNHN